MSYLRKSLHHFTPERVLPPGSTLLEVLESLGMTQTELAKRTGLSVKHVNQIAGGSAVITPETALLLEMASRVPARIWNSLEAAHRESLSRQEEERRLEADVDWLDDLPIKEMVQRGALEKGATQVEQVRRVCEFFGVANKSAWNTLWHKPTAYRRSQAFTSDPGAVAAWLRLGENQAEDIECKPFDRAKLFAALTTIRTLTREQNPKVWFPEMRYLCAEAGVAVVLEPEFKRTRINGAARWLTPDKALIQSSLRHRWSDIFWFTFFHEAGHLLLHSKKETFINDQGPHSGVEQEADVFAARTLIPDQYEAELPYLENEDDVRSFAQRLGIADGIVVGRLQHDGRWSFSRGTNLKQRFVFVPSTPEA